MYKVNNINAWVLQKKWGMKRTHQPHERQQNREDHQQDVGLATSEQVEARKREDEKQKNVYTLEGIIRRIVSAI